jgi:small subunit ribosomal protein S17
MAETATPETATETSTRGRPKTRIGIVTSNKMSKTVTVTVRRRTAHAQYGKVQTRRE